MITKFKSVFLVSFIFLSGAVVSQTNTATPANDGFDLPKKVVETKITEVVATDSLPASELLKRSVNWVKEESLKYIKTSGATTGSKVECTATFPVKPKDLNPETDYTGKIVMKVVIECKDNKYKYTVSQIKHVSKNGKASGGSIDNVIPECGSMELKDLTWKKLKGEAMRGANLVVADLKAGMMKPSTETATEEW